MLGMDANGPRVDHPDIEQSRWWTEEEALVLGSGVPIDDALRLWYGHHPAELKHRVWYYLKGPLAIRITVGGKGSTRGAAATVSASHPTSASQTSATCTKRPSGPAATTSLVVVDIDLP